MRHGGRVIDESGRDWRLSGATPKYPDRTPLSPHHHHDNVANTPEEVTTACEGCGYTKPSKDGGKTKAKRRFYSVAADEGSRGAGAATGGARAFCQVCHEKRRRERTKSPSAPSPGDGGRGAADAATSHKAPANGGATFRVPARRGKGQTGEQPQTRVLQCDGPYANTKVKAAAVMRSRVEGSVKGGEIVCWQDAAQWPTAERAKVGEEKMQAGSAQKKVGTLNDASMLKRIRDLSLEDVLAGSDAAERERRYGAFFDTPLGTMSKSTRIRSTEGGSLWCFEAQLREDITPERRSNATGQYAFFQSASTKSYTAMNGIIDRILGSVGGGERVRRQRAMTCRRRRRGVSPEDDLDVDGLLGWVKKQADEDKTFALRKQFLLHDFPACFTFRLALRTGVFKQRCDALRRNAPIIFINGKDCYQFLVAYHPVEMDVGRVISSYIDKLGPMAQLREASELEFEREFIEESMERNRTREISLERAPEVEAAIGGLCECPLFNACEDHDTFSALDGRVAPMATGEEILSAPEQARAKMESFLKYFTSKPGSEVVKPTKKKLRSFASKNPTNKATKSKGRTSAMKDNIANAYAGGWALKALMLNVGDEPFTSGFRDAPYGFPFSSTTPRSTLSSLLSSDDDPKRHERRYLTLSATNEAKSMPNPRNGGSCIGETGGGTCNSKAASKGKAGFLERECRQDMENRVQGTQGLRASK
eukprot:g10766.t1